MKCPRCDYEWDVRQSPCPGCHLYVRMPDQLRSTGRIVSGQKSTSRDSVVFPTPHDLQMQPPYQRPELTSQRSNQPPFPVHITGTEQSRSLTTERLSLKRTTPLTPNAEAYTPGTPE